MSYVRPTRGPSSNFVT